MLNCVARPNFVHPVPAGGFESCANATQLGSTAVASNRSQEIIFQSVFKAS
jgi:hypothetical protein